ncbi:DUF2076 domain-containing protein [Bradyrhizobium sp. JYMT SZCCT0428]|uniref:DUF2076 domain-containing protein n=1 Tax=Bradyrhizobium sp. JYMT SZCCT0428 TaxID=2807673 RepID=UPI001BA44E07|nr:DUF2076 domain-containing protein [Bradyrhizobium sp. JYMT SZCCT0428]MBR1155681.1 DUF2076 domain-containing protein [Bradyrhizobium sp. JYMT SZCCT0428]
MTPQERQLIDDLFDRLAKLENTPRDPEAMSAIVQGLRGAPNAVYALVQTALVQDEALKRANDRIQQLEGGHAGEQNQPGGFLDSMRDTIFGQSQPRGSVPNVRSPGMGGRPVWNSGEVVQQTQGQQGPGQYGQPGYGQQPAYGQPYGGAQQPPPLGGGGGGSFLGTAAAAAAGVVGGSMLLGGIRSMMGGGNQQAAFGGDSGGHRGSVEDRRPGGSDQAGGDLAREAGANDIGSSGSSRTGLFDDTSNDDNYDDMDDGFDGDGGGDDD